MIQFNFFGDPYPTFEQMQELKSNFIDKLGPFRDEFEQKGGIVTFNFYYAETDTRRITLNVRDVQSLPDFTIRWNEYTRNIQTGAR